MICTVWKVEDFINKIESTETLISSSSIGQNRYSILNTIRPSQKGLYKVDIDAKMTACDGGTGKITIEPVYLNGNSANGSVQSRDIVEFYDYNPNWGYNPYDTGIGNVSNLKVPYTNAQNASLSGILRMTAKRAYGCRTVTKPTISRTSKYVKFTYTNNVVSAINEYSSLSDALANWPTVDSDISVDVFYYAYEANFPETYPEMALPFSNFNFPESVVSVPDETAYLWKWDDSTIFRIRPTYIPVAGGTIFYEGEYYLYWYDVNHTTNNGMKYVTLDQFYPQYFEFQFTMIASSTWAKSIPVVYSRLQIIISVKT